MVDIVVALVVCDLVVVPGSVYIILFCEFTCFKVNSFNISSLKKKVFNIVQISESHSLP